MTRVRNLHRPCGLAPATRNARVTNVSVRVETVTRKFFCGPRQPAADLDVSSSRALAGHHLLYHDHAKLTRPRSNGTCNIQMLVVVAETY